MTIAPFSDPLLSGGSLSTLALLSIIGSGAGIALWWSERVSTVRSAFEVGSSLLDELTGEHDDASSAARKAQRFVLTGEAGELGLYQPADLRSFHRRIALIPWFAALIGIVFRYILFPLDSGIGVTIGCAIMGVATGYLVSQAQMRSQAARFARSIEFSLPLAMERLVMAVQAGLDLISAVQVLVDEERTHPTQDPVITLLGMVLTLTESGLPFEQALSEVGTNVPHTAIRHAFTHLAVAHREGGELVMPLKELADATQSFYQETVEEEIAKLPVRATVPLLVTFAGLIICFVTSPLMQIITMTATVTEGLK